MKQIGIDTLSRLKSKQKDPLIREAVSVISEFLDSFERSEKQIEEQKQLIAILKEGKEYYQRQCKNNCLETEFMQLNQEKHQLTLLLGGHRKANKQLKQHSQELQKQIQQLQQQLKEQAQLIRENEEKYLTITLEKQLLQKQWNKVVKAVKRKITQIVEKKSNNPERPYRQSSLAKGQKQKQNRNVQAPRPVQKGQVLQLQDRAQRMIRFLDDQMAIDQLEGLFHCKTSAKKDKQRNELVQQKQVLRHIDLNQVKFPFDVQFD